MTLSVRTFVVKLDIGSLTQETNSVDILREKGSSVPVKVEKIGEIQHTKSVSRLKPRSDIHWARRIWHMVGVALVCAIFVSVERPIALVLLVAACFVFILPDIYRLKNPSFNSFVLRRMRMIVRDTEARELSGVTFILMGISITIFLFPKSVATLALLFLAFGDPTASIFGVLYGKDKLIWNKSLQGASAAFVVCSVVAFFFYLSQGLMTERLILAAIVSGLIGSLSEVISIKRLDDNLTFPIICGFFLWGLFHLFGAYS